MYLAKNWVLAYHLPDKHDALGSFIIITKENIAKQYVWSYDFIVIYSKLVQILQFNSEFLWTVNNDLVVMETWKSKFKYS